MAGPIPESTDHITAPFMTGALGLGEVEAVDCVVVGEDRGFTGVVARCTLRFRDPEPGMPASVIVKLPMAERREVSHYLAAQQYDPAAAQARFTRSLQEIRFYREIAPRTDLLIPRANYLAADEARRTMVLVLEDVTDAREGDALAGCPETDAGAVLEAIAPLHARWWDSDDLQTMDWLPAVGGNARQRQERFNERADEFTRRYAARLTAALRELVDELRTGYAATIEQLDRAPVTIIHADLHLDNVLFRTEKGRTTAALLDWQTVARGPAVLDLTESLLAPLKQGGPAATVAALLAGYHAALVRHGVTAYTLADLQRDVQHAYRQHAAGTIGWLGRSGLEDQTGRERDLAEAAFDDLHRLVTLLT